MLYRKWKNRFLKSSKFTYTKLNFLAFLYYRLFFGALIKRGNKLAAFNLFINIRYQMKLKESFDPYDIFFVAMLQITPEIILGVLPLGSMKYGVPLPITEKKKINFAVKWIVKLLRDKYFSITSKNAADLLIASAYKQGEAINKQQEVYDNAKLNRHFVRKLLK